MAVAHLSELRTLRKVALRLFTAVPKTNLGPLFRLDDDDDDDDDDDPLARPRLPPLDDDPLAMLAGDV